MGGVRAARRFWSALGSGLAAALLLLASSPASGFEFADGRVQVHGFYEAQVRSLVRDMDFSDDWDLTQWYNVLNVEIEADVAPDGWGPFDLISTFARIEVRYDCIWTHGCTLFDGANAYGSRSEFGRLPRRLMDARRQGHTFQLDDGDRRHFYGIERADLGLGDACTIDASGRTICKHEGSRKAFPIFDVDGITTLFGIVGRDGLFGTADDPAPFYFSSFENCRFAARQTKGVEDGVDTQVLVHSVNENDCEIQAIGSMSDKPNPFRSGDSDPDVLPGGGAFALPFRPAPQFGNGSTDRRSKARAKGMFYPNARLAALLRDGEFDHEDQNFTQNELAFNRGASQQDEKELKELFVDLELFDSRLWLRLGKQQIVWGKTELFRTTDQFNPQDLALGSLTSLEESRIALWAARAVWSFYDVGPLNDVRFELGVNVDDFEPADLGRCGEPYTPLPACNLTFGMMAHGFSGVALAGRIAPPHPWNSWKGLEVGGRLEFRWDRFSFAFIDFYGYNDIPYADQVFRYSRNVDPTTGRSRHTVSEGSCITGDNRLEPACLGAVGPGTDGTFGTLDDNLPFRNALEHHSVNLQLFGLICSTSIGFSSLDFAACGQSVFNSRTVVVPGVRIAPLLSNLIVGNPDAHEIARVGLTSGVPIPHLLLSQDPCDGFLADCVTPGPRPVPALNVNGPTLNQLLTVQQQALLGCGQFYNTDCERDGIDLSNAEASALLQSVPGFEGTPERGLSDPDFPFADAPGEPQAGTFSFRLRGSGPVCTRELGGRLVILPGCRSPGRDGVGGTADDGLGYDINVDGSLPGLHPFFDPASPFFRGSMATVDQRFVTEMAGLSFNAVMALVGNAGTDEIDPDGIPGTGDEIPDPSITQFDPRDASVTGSDGFDNDFDGETDEADEGDPDHIGPYRRDGCSFVVPFLCGTVSAFDSITGIQRNTVRAGGTARFGRRDFIWHGGSDLVLRYEKRNVLGLSMDFAEDVTKTNWGVEFTWIAGLPTANNDEVDGLSDTNQFNLTVAVDRPTFINFLNQNRTFFITTQWFMQYVGDYEQSMPGSGPFNVLAILNLSTGYFQDRLLPAVTFVYDFRSNSSAVLPQVGYRFTENFSVTFGLALFGGRFERKKTPLTPVSLDNRVGEGAYKSHVENGLSVIRERDEAFLRVRYTF